MRVMLRAAAPCGSSTWKTRRHTPPDHAGQRRDSAESVETAASACKPKNGRDARFSS